MTVPIRLAQHLITHIPVIERLAELRALNQCRLALEKRNAHAAIVSAEYITVIGQTSEPHPTPKYLFGVLRQAKRHDAAEYAVTPQELSALCAHLTTELTTSATYDALSTDLRRISEQLNHPATPLLPDDPAAVTIDAPPAPHAAR